MQEMN